MVQIGNLHIGPTQSVKLPTISIQEAAYLWDFLCSRYKCLEETGIYLNLAKDPDFITFIKTGIVLILERQVKVIEKEMDRYKIPLPTPGPKTFSNLNDKKFEIRDEFMFQQIFEGCQYYIDYLARITRSMVTNDPLRDTFAGFLKEELLLFDQLCKYAKAKGWLQVPPMYH